MDLHRTIEGWLARLPANAGVADIALASGLDEDVVATALAEELTPSPPTDDHRPPREVVEATLAWAEATFQRTMPREDPPRALRRYALRCLSGLTRSGGMIARATRLPSDLEPVWLDHVLNDRPLADSVEQRVLAHQEDAAQWKAKAVARARSIQDQWNDRDNPPDALSLLRLIPPTPAYEYPLDRTRGPDAQRNAITERLGPEGQMLAASKTRMPWSDRILFNAQVRLVESETALWRGDLWLFPESSPPVLDPRPGLRDIATRLGPVAVCTESGRERWRMDGDGVPRVPDSERDSMQWVVDRLEASGWPRYLRWPLYP